MLDLTFSAADKSDIPALLQFNRQLIETYEDLKSIDFEKVLLWVERKLWQNIHSYNCVWMDGQKIGYYRLHSSDDTFELDDFYIFPEYQNRGFGTAILQKCITEAHGPIQLYVFLKNEAAIRLYKRMGFEEFKRIGNTRMVMIYNG